MSVHEKAKRFIVVVFVFVGSFPIWGGLLSTLLGTGGVMFLVAPVALLAGAITLWVFKCSRCGAPVFCSAKTGPIQSFWPWPQKTCVDCGDDLTRKQPTS